MIPGLLLACLAYTGMGCKMSSTYISTHNLVQQNNELCRAL